MNLAKDLYTNYKLNNKGITKKVIQDLEIGGKKSPCFNLFRSQRSLSNPLDYISDSSNEKKHRLINNNNQLTNR